MLRDVTITMICSTLASLWKFQCFWRPVSSIYDGAFIVKIVSRYVYSQKSSIVDARMGSKYASAFWRLFSKFLFLQIILHYKTLKICYFFKVLYFFSFIQRAIKHLITTPFDLLNTIPLSRTKTLVNNLLMSKF